MSANDRQIGGDHYRSDYQHWDFIEEWGIGYIEGCATKYLARWRKKNGVGDLVKSLHYVEKLKELSLGPIKRGPRGFVPHLYLMRFSGANKLGPLEFLVTEILCTKWVPRTLDVAISTIQDLIQKAEQEQEECQQ